MKKRLWRTTVLWLLSAAFLLPPGAGSPANAAPVSVTDFAGLQQAIDAGEPDILLDGSNLNVNLTGILNLQGATRIDLNGNRLTGAAAIPGGFTGIGTNTLFLDNVGGVKSYLNAVSEIGFGLSLGANDTGGRVALTGSATDTPKVKGLRFYIDHWYAGTHTLVTSADAITFDPNANQAITVGGLRTAWDDPSTFKGSFNWAPRFENSVAVAADGKSATWTTGLASGYTANTIYWTGAVDNQVKLGHSAMNWRSGSSEDGINNDLYVHEKDKLAFIGVGGSSTAPGVSNNLDVVFTDPVTKAGGFYVKPVATSEAAKQRDFNFTTGAVELSDTGFERYTDGNVTWTLREGSGAHKLDVFKSTPDGNTGGGKTTLEGDHLFTPYTEGGTIAVSIGGYQDMYYKGHIGYERSEANLGGTHHIDADGSLTFTGSSNVGWLGDPTTDANTINLGATGTFWFDSVSGRMTLHADQDGGQTTFTATADGKNALQLDGKTQELRVFNGGRLALHNKNAVSQEIDFVLDGGALHVHNGSVLTTAHSGEALRMHDRSKVVLNNSSAEDDKLNSTLRVSGTELSVTKTINYYGTERWMQLSPQTIVTLKDKTTGALEGIEWYIDNGQLNIGKDSHLISKELLYNSTQPAGGWLHLVNKTVATLAENADAKTVLEGHNIVVADSSVTAAKAKGTVISGNAIAFDNKATLTADSSANVIDAVGAVFFTSGSSLTANGAATDTVLRGKSVTFDNSSFAATDSKNAIAASGNVNFTKSSIKVGDTANSVISGADVTLTETPVEAGTSTALIRASGNVKLTGAAAKTSVKAGAAKDNLISGANIALSNIELTAETPSTLLYSNGVASITSSSVKAGDSDWLIIGDGAVNITGSTLEAGASAVLISAGDDITVTNSALKAEAARGTLISADNNITFDNASLTATTAESFFVGNNISFKNNSVVTVGAAADAVIMGANVSFDGSRIMMTEVSGKPAISTTDFTFNNSTLGFNPDANGLTTLIHVNNLPVFTGQNALEFEAVPAGNYTLVQTAFVNPEDDDLIAKAYDAAIKSIDDRITVAGIAIGKTDSGRVEWSGLRYNKDEKSLVVSATVENEERAWTGDVDSWKGETDDKVIMGDRLVFDSTPANKYVNPTEGMVASDVIVNSDDDYVFEGADGFQLAINGDNVTIDGQAGTGTLLKQGKGELLLIDMGNVAMQAGDIQAGTVALFNGGLSGISETNRAAITFAEGTTLRSITGAVFGVNTIGNYADVVMRSGSTMELGGDIRVATTASLTLEEGVLLDLLGDSGPVASAYFVADGIQPLEEDLAARGSLARAGESWGVIISRFTDGVQVNEFGRWQARSAASYSAGTDTLSSVSVAANGALSVFGGGSHIFADGAALTMASGSILHMDLTDREKTLAAIDSSAGTGTVAIADGTALYVSSNVSTQGEWLIWKHSEAISENTFDPANIKFVDAVTLTPIVKRDEEGNVIESDDTLEVDYQDTEAWLNASVEAVYGESDYEANYYAERDHGKPNARRALQRWDHVEFADMAALHSKWYMNGGWAEGNKLDFADDIIANGSNMTPEGMATTFGQNIIAFRGMTQAFLGNMNVSAPSVASTNSLQFSGMDSPRSAERLVGSFRGTRGLQAQAEGNRMDNTLKGMGDLIAANLTANSLIGNWKPASESTRSMLTNSAGMPSLYAADGSSVGYGLRFFGGYLGSFSTKDSDNGYSGYDSHMNGFMIGASYDFNDHWTLGGYVAYTTGTTDFDDIDAEVDTDATQGGLALTYKHGNGFRVTGDFGYGHFENDSDRKLRVFGRNFTHSGSSDQDMYSFGLGFAYDWNPAWSPATTITPYLDLRYTHSESDGYRESGQILPVRVGDSDLDSFTSSLGVSVAHDFMPKDNVVITPRLTLGWLHEYGDDDLSVNASFVGSRESYKTHSYEQDSDKFQGGAAIDFLILNTNDTAFGVKLMYGAEVGGNGVDQNVYGGLEFRF